MELRPGYKRTEIGVIPEDWDVVQLKEIGSVKNGINKPKEAFGRGNPFVNLMDVFGVPKIRSTDRLGLLLTTEKDRAVYDLRAGDVLFVRSSVKPSGVGLATLVTESLPDTVFSGFLLRFRDNGALIKGYKEFCFHEERFRKELIENSTVSANTNINQTALKNLHIPVPRSRAEQQAIAAALSDMDASIAALSLLIAKKRDMRQGAMQRLLTGQTRLPGFIAPWQEKRLGELGNIRSGGTPSTTDPTFWDGGIPWCTPTDITALSGRKALQATSRTISARGLSASSAEVIPPRSLIMTSRATIGTCAINSVPITTNQGFKNIVPNAEIDVDFLYYLMGMQTARLVALCGGSTFLEIGKKQVSGFEVALPDNKVEQTAIAAVLSDMDAEIDALDAHLNKIRALKQAMMQALLTGRVRLPAQRDATPQTKKAAHA